MSFVICRNCKYPLRRTSKKCPNCSESVIVEDNIAVDSIVLNYKKDDKEKDKIKSNKYFEYKTEKNKIIFTKAHDEVYLVRRLYKNDEINKDDLIISKEKKIIKIIINP